MRLGSCAEPRKPDVQECRRLEDSGEGCLWGEGGGNEERAQGLQGSLYSISCPGGTDVALLFLMTF